MHVGETVSCYNNKLLSLLDKHAPQKTIKIKNVPSSPWFDQEYSSLRRERRKAERKFWRSKNDIDKKAYLLLQKKCTEMVKSKKNNYVTHKLDAQNSSKELFSIVNNLIDREKEVVLPDTTSDLDLANQFKDFFSNKVEKIIGSIPSNYENLH